MGIKPNNISVSFYDAIFFPIVYRSTRHFFELENGITITLKHHTILSYFLLFLCINIYSNMLHNIMLLLIYILSYYSCKNIMLPLFMLIYFLI